VSQSTAGRYVVFQDRSGAWRWRLVARNGRIVAVGEAHTRPRDAARAAAAVARIAGSARLPGGAPGRKP
jgi:uncharacterized protein YegP (UPF0339 family)